MNRKAIIFGIKGASLTLEEEVILKNYKPWGIILFSRNIKSIVQLKLLIKKIRKAVKDKYYPILIDQEGGKVSRLNKILDFSLFSQSYFEKIFKRDKKLFSKVYSMYIEKVSEILNVVGININTVPVLDVRRKFSKKIIGSRSFSSKPNIVSMAGNLSVLLFKKKKIATVMKHVPGHGLSKQDTHKYSSILKADKKQLIKNHFKPFKLSKAPFAMTAHIIYKVYDPIYTATHSKIIINEVIRKHIAFKGILISDDISMKALKYNIKKNALMALQAGCNLVLHCNGNIKEMNELIKIIPKIDNFTQKKTSQFYKFLR